MNGELELLASFAEERQAAGAVAALRRAQADDIRVFAPIPSEHVEEAFERRKSRVRLWVLLGGIAGALSGLAITIGTSLEWNLVAGGKPIVSLPPYIIITFEMMVLLGGISGVLGFFFHSRLPALESQRGFNSRFAQDHFGVLVRCAASDGDRLEGLLREAGALAVERVGAAVA